MKNSLLNRLSAFMLAALLCLSLTGCGGKNVSEDSSSAGDNTIEESADSGKNDVWVALSMNGRYTRPRYDYIRGRPPSSPRYCVGTFADAEQPG